MSADAAVDYTDARKLTGLGPGYRAGRRAALIGFYPKSVLELPGLSRSPFPGRASLPVFCNNSGSFALNQRFRLAAQDVRFQPVVQVQS